MANNLTYLEFQRLFKFATVEDQPLMSTKETAIIVSLSSCFLFFGILLNARILTILTERKSGLIIDKLMVSNTIISSLGHSVVLVYYIASHVAYPMSDYIGVIGCLVCVHFLDAFIRFYNFCFPVAMALLRYLFVVQNLWVRGQGMARVANAVILVSVFAPVVMTLSVQFPLSDTLPLAYSRCMGRFETYFNPLHPEPITPGWQQGERYCIVIGERVRNSQTGTIEFFLYFSWLFCCRATLYLTRLVMFGIPEMLLYLLTFRHILRHNHKTARSGIISQDTIKRRKLQNKLNIMVTFWAWLAQLLTNIIYLILMLVIFGKARYYHALLAICTISLNFNVLPLFYIIMADEDLKGAIQNSSVIEVCKLFLGI